MTNLIAITALTTAISLPAAPVPPPRETLVASAERLAARVAPERVVPQRRDKDSVGNGIVIGALAGAAADWFIAPRVFCGAPGFDRECEINVKYKLFWPAVAGGALAGWLVDALL